MTRKRMSSSKTQPMYRGPLISELEQAVRSSSPQEREVRTLRRITDLFLGTKEKLTAKNKSKCSTRFSVI